MSTGHARILLGGNASMEEGARPAIVIIVKRGLIGAVGSQD
jgi:hypothetical protein